MGKTCTTSVLACPRCSGHHLKRMALPHWIPLNWCVNPLTCIAEIIFGGRMPKELFCCQDCSDALWADCLYFRCPSCNALHKERMWRGSNSSGHWFGLLCPSCLGMIPCLWNIWSLLILFVTAPIWYLPARLVRPHWLQFEQRRIAALLGRPPVPDKKVRPISIVLFFGIIGLGISLGTIWGSGRSEKLWIHALPLPVWLAMGVLWALVVKRRANRRRRQTP